MTGMLYQDDRTWLYTEHEERYTLGDPTLPLLVLNDVDAYSCAWAAEVPDGADAPSVVLPMDNRQDGHGGYSGTPTFEPRAITLAGTCAAPTRTALRAAHRRFLTAVLGSIPGFVRYTHLDEDPARGLWVKPTGKPKWRELTDRAAEFSFVIVAEDPIWTGPALSYGPVRIPTLGGEGGYPLGASGALMPWTASGGTVAVTVITVPNVGDQSSQAVWTVTGPVPRPRIQLSNGRYISLAADLGALDVWVVDTAAGTSTVNGVNRYDAWGAGSVFPLIPPGGVEVRLRSGAGGQDPAAGLSVLTAPSWK